MTRNEFLSAVADELVGLSKADIDRSLEFYGEMIDDRIEDGESEESAVSAIGTPKDVARHILMEMPLPKIVKAKAFGKRKLRAWEIVLIALGSPLWLPLLLAAAVVVLAVYIIIWTADITFWALDISMFACSLTFAFLTVISFGAGNIGNAVLFLGTSLVLAGASMLLCFGCRILTALTVKLGKIIWKAIKTMFIGGNDQ